MSGIQSKNARHTRRQENMRCKEETNQSKLNHNWHDVKISREDFKTVIMTVLHMSQELSRNVEHIQMARIKL